MAPAAAPTPAGAAVTASAGATAAVSSAYIGYVTNGFDSLVATSWAADVTVSPPTAKGNGELLVDGQRAPTGFDVNGGRLRIENADGTREDVGAARGVLDPPRILDPKAGLPALLGMATAVDADTVPSDIRGAPMIRVRAQLPAEAGLILLPAGAITGTDPLPVTLWLDPNTQILRQLILTVGAWTGRPAGIWTTSAVPSPADSCTTQSRSRSGLRPSVSVSMATTGPKWASAGRSPRCRRMVMRDPSESAAPWRPSPAVNRKDGGRPPLSTEYPRVSYGLLEGDPGLE